MSFFENTRKPVGLGGKIMVAMMNLGHSPVARWGLRFLELTLDRHGAGLRLRRRCEHEKAAEKMPAGYREGHRLLDRQCGESAESQPDCNSGGALCGVAGQCGAYHLRKGLVRCGNGL